VEKFVNLSAHPINLPVLGLTIPTGEVVARVNTTVRRTDVVNGVEIIKVEYGEIVGLPEPKEGTYYIVSAVVLNAVLENTDRTDCVSPFRPIRNYEGKTVGCEGFRRN